MIRTLSPLTNVTPSTAAISPFASAVSVAPTPSVPLSYVTAAKAPVVATCTDALISRPSATESTYDLLAASPSAVGVARLVIFALSTDTAPVPFGSSIIF